MIKVEVKYRMPDAAAFDNRLIAEFQGRLLRVEQQRDFYFSHPARDFRQTDEALRIRTCDGETSLCYKGPRLDSATKTRRELE